MNKFPQNPFDILDPNIRWAPSQEDLQEKAYEQLIPPLVYKIRLAKKSGATAIIQAHLIRRKQYCNSGLDPMDIKKATMLFNTILPSGKRLNPLFTCMKLPKPEINLN